MTLMCSIDRGQPPAWHLSAVSDRLEHVLQLCKSMGAIALYLASQRAGPAKAELFLEQGLVPELII